YRQWQVPADTVGQGIAGLVYDAAEHGHMLAEVATDQAAVDMPQHVGGLKSDRSVALQLALLIQQASSHEFQQHGDEGRRRAMAGHISQVEAQLRLGDAEVIDEVAGQVQRGKNAVLEVEFAAVPGGWRQHVQLHLTTCCLIVTQLAQMVLQLEIGLFQAFADALVLIMQTGPLQRSAHRMLQHFQIILGADQIVAGPLTQGFDHIAHHTISGDDDYRQHRVLLGDPPEQVDTAQAGILDLQVAQHQFRALPRYQRQPFPGATGLQYLEATLFKMNRDAVTNLIVIINNQQSGARKLHRFPTSLPRSQAERLGHRVYSKSDSSLKPRDVSRRGRHYSHPLRQATIDRTVQDQKSSSTCPSMTLNSRFCNQTLRTKLYLSPRMSRSWDSNPARVSTTSTPSAVLRLGTWSIWPRGL